MRKEKLSEDQICLLRKVFLNKAPSSLDLFNRLLVGSVNKNERLFVCELISEEFCEAGVNEVGEPTDLGMALEGLLDFINRPNISH